MSVELHDGIPGRDRTGRIVLVPGVNSFQNKYSRRSSIHFDGIK